MAESKTIWVRPADGLKFRHHATKVVHEGPFQADPQDLDVVRSLSWGALVQCEEPGAVELAPGEPMVGAPAVELPPAGDSPNVAGLASPARAGKRAPRADD